MTSDVNLFVEIGSGRDVLDYNLSIMVSNYHR